MFIAYGAGTSDGCLVVSVPRKRMGSIFAEQLLSAPTQLHATDVLAAQFKPILMRAGRRMSKV